MEPTDENPQTVVTLEHLSEEHFAALYLISCDKESIEDFQKASPDHDYFMSWIKDAMSDNEYAWTILVRGLVAGLICLENFQEPECEIGFFVAKQHQHRGAATKAVRQALNIIERDHPHVKRVLASVTASNTASQKLLEKCSFRHSRTFKKNWEWGGALHDSFEYIWCPKSQEP